MDHAHKVDVPLAHTVDVSEATKCLLHQLDCDDWYVACHHEHLFVFHLTQGAVDRYAVSYQCTSPVEKGFIVPARHGRCRSFRYGAKTTCMKTQ